jgi:uncharacterized membrane protein
MATLSAIRFSTAGGADAALADVRARADTGQLAWSDLAIMSWPPGSRRPALLSCSLTGRDGRLGEKFWNLLFSHLFYLPLATAEAGVPYSATCSSLAGLGIRDDFLQTARARLGPGTSALFLLTGHATVDPVVLLLQRLEFTVMSTNLTLRQVQALREVFQPTYHQEQTNDSA